jgi:hypothetical protein
MKIKLPLERDPGHGEKRRPYSLRHTASLALYHNTRCIITVCDSACTLHRGCPHAWVFCCAHL